MTWHKRSHYPHQNLKARQDSGNNNGLLPGSGFKPTSVTTSTPNSDSTPTPNAGSGNDGKGGKGGKGSDTTTTTTTPTTTPSPSPSPSPSPNDGGKSPTTTHSGTTNTSGSSSSTSSTSPSSSGSPSSSSVSTSTSDGHHTATNTPTHTAVIIGPSTDVVTFTPTVSSVPSDTSGSSSSSNNTNSVGGMSTGAIIGAIAGGLFGIIILLAIGSWILRWWSKRSAERDFVDDYNSPDDMAATGGHDAFAPPHMAQHSSSPSFSSGAGMAGQGVLASRAAAMAGPGAYHGGYGGHSHADEDSIAGPYSSQPQVQAPYNAEAYGQYVPYNGNPGYQEAMRGYQGQRGYEGQVEVGYAISEPPPAPQTPAPRSTSPKTTAAAALAAAHAAATSHAPSQPAPAHQRQSAAFTEDDAYGGF